MPATWTNSQIISNLLRAGLSWSGSTITYKFPTTAPSWSFSTGEGAGFSALVASQKAMAQAALALWDDLIAPDFVEVTGTSNLTFQNTTTGIGYAHAYYPGGWSGSGSVWFNPAYNSGTNNLVTPTAGKWGYLAYIHEIGHALGLDHPGEYNGGSPTYAGDALYTQDTIQYTVMSYFDAINTGADWIASNGQEYFAQTPMLHDILAIQALYGAETTTRAGNTVYGFNSNAGNSLYDFTQNAHPILTIWDSGGNDTLDLSGFTTASTINLNQGSFTDCDGMTKNIAIAYGCDIENAKGGSGNDTITGNALDNLLDGGAGNDILTGGAGADILIGGAGNDTFYADALDYLLQFSGGTGYDILYISGTLSYTFDYLSYGFEEMFQTGSPPPPPPPPPPGDIIGTGLAETLNGTTAGDVIKGLAGNDTLNGSDGDDTLFGGDGNDKINGGDGTDTASYEDATAAVTVSLAIVKAQKTIGSGADTLSGIENLTGSAFNDKLTGSSGNNVISGLDGNDTLNGGAGNDTLLGGAGNDVLDGSAGADTMSGGSGNDVYVVDNAGDIVDETGGDGTDLVQATFSINLADTMFIGDIENIQLTGAAAINATGNDLDNVIEGNIKTNTLDGGNGVDTVSYANATAGVKVSLSIITAQFTGSKTGYDTLLNFENLAGSKYADTLTGDGNGNVITGLGGNDVISGGAGNDVLVGGLGKDTLTGGTDADTFVFAGLTDSGKAAKTRDLITDFVAGEDHIDLSAIDAITGGADDAFVLGGSAFTGVAGELTVSYAAGQTIVSGDINGDLKVDFQIALTGTLALTTDDFIL